MDKKIIKTEKRLCPCCMEEHDVKTVIVNETSAFKDTKVEYGACYLYCDKADEYYSESILNIAQDSYLGAYIANNMGTDVECYLIDITDIGA